MANFKNSGKNLHFYFGAIEKAVRLADFNVDYAEDDATDTGTATDCTESVLGRGSRKTKIDQDLRAALGTEVVTGTLVAGTGYLVTGGTITEGALSYASGDLFTSDGTGTASGTNKVKPLGAHISSKTLACTIATNPCYVTELKYTEDYSADDSTDTSTNAEGTEIITGRAKRSGSLTVIQKYDVADLLTSAPAAQAFVLTFGTSQTISGNATFKKKGYSVDAGGGLVKVSYDFSFQGAVTSTLENILTPAVSTAVKLISKKGTSTNKEVTGFGTITKTEISGSVDRPMVVVTYDMTWNGLPTDTAVAN